MKRFLILFFMSFHITAFAQAQTPAGYILTDYGTARLEWDNPTPGPNNRPDVTVVQCSVNQHPYIGNVPYPGNSIRISEIVSEPQDGEYVCLTYAVNRAGRSENSNTVRFMVLRAPLPPSGLRVMP